MNITLSAGRLWNHDRIFVVLDDGSINDADVSILAEGTGRGEFQVLQSNTAVKYLTVTLQQILILIELNAFNECRMTTVFLMAWL